MTAAMASAVVELADLVLDERVLAVAHQLGGDAAAGCRPRGASAGRGPGLAEAEPRRVADRGGGNLDGAAVLEAPLTAIGAAVATSARSSSWRSTAGSPRATATSTPSAAA
jgi:hypothetical protein